MEQSDLLGYLIQVLENLGVRYGITGSIATMLYGEPRMTNDIDVVVELPASKIDDFCGAFPSPDYYLSRASVAEAVAERFQFNVIHPTSGLKIDVMVATNSDLDRSQFGRLMRIKLATGVEGSFISPEDAIVNKLIFFQEGGSEKHLRDITGILRTRTTPLDRDYIKSWATKLGVASIWEGVVNQADPGNQPDP